jgi:hypothetical protein
MGREIESRQGIHRVVVKNIKTKLYFETSCVLTLLHRWRKLECFTKTKIFFKENTRFLVVFFRFYIQRWRSSTWLRILTT